MQVVPRCNLHTTLCASSAPRFGSHGRLDLAPPRGKRSYALEPTKHLGLERLDDCGLVGHDVAKMSDTPLSAHHPCGAGRASGVAEQQDNTE
jgi:hypothetical protein